MSILNLAQHFNTVLLLSLKLCGVFGTGGKWKSFDIFQDRLLWIHHFSLMLFLGVVFYRLALVLRDRRDKLKRMKIYGARPDETFGPLVFLICGLYAFIQPRIELWLWIKIIIMIIAYVLARFAVDRINKKLAVLSLVGFFLCYAISKVKLPTFPRHNYIEDIRQNPNYTISSWRIYESECQSCHGTNGNATIFTGANLKLSSIDTMQTAAVILNGRRDMPSYKDVLTDAQAKDLAAYIMQFRDPWRKDE